MPQLVEALNHLILVMQLQQRREMTVRGRLAMVYPLLRALLRAKGASGTPHFPFNQRIFN